MGNNKKEIWILLLSLPVILGVGLWGLAQLTSPVDQQLSKTQDLAPKERARALTRGMLPPPESTSPLRRGREVAASRALYKERPTHPLSREFQAGERVSANQRELLWAKDLRAFSTYDLSVDEELYRDERGYRIVRIAQEQSNLGQLVFQDPNNSRVLIATGEMVLMLRGAEHLRAIQYELDGQADVEIVYINQAQTLVVVRAQDSSRLLELQEQLSELGGVSTVELDLVDLPLRLR